MQHVSKVLIFDSNDNGLLVWRSETHPRYPHHPDLPGGLVEIGEDPLEGAIREVFEETGLTLTEESTTHASHVITTKPKTNHLFISQLAATQPEVVISWEHERYEWIPRSELLDHINTTDPFMRLTREYLKSYLGQE